MIGSEVGTGLGVLLGLGRGLEAVEELGFVVATGLKTEVVFGLELEHGAECAHGAVAKPELESGFVAGAGFGFEFGFGPETGPEAAAESEVVFEMKLVPGVGTEAEPSAGTGLGTGPE